MAPEWINIRALTWIAIRTLLTSEGAPLDGEIEAAWRSAPPGRFGGGTNDIQRRIIASRGLGLPR